MVVIRITTYLQHNTTKCLRGGFSMPCLLTYSISGRKTPYGEISSALSSPPSCTRIVVSEDYDRQTSLAYIN